MFALTPNYVTSLYDEVTQKTLDEGLTDFKDVVDGDIVSISTSLRRSNEYKSLEKEGANSLLVRKNGSFTWMKFREYAQSFPDKVLKASMLTAFILDDVSILNTSTIAADKLLTDEENDTYLEAFMMKHAVIITHEDTDAAIEGWTENGSYIAQDTPKYIQIVLKECASAHEIVAKSEEITSSIQAISDFMLLHDDATDEPVKLGVNFNT